MSDTPKIPDWNTTDLPKGWHATLPAHWLPKLAPLCADDVARIHLRGIRIEPHSAGGCLLIATDGFAIAVVHEPAASCSEAATLTFPPRLIDACKPVDLPELDREGGSFERPDLPEWIVPNEVICTSAAAMVMTKGEDGGALCHAFRPVPKQRAVSFDREFCVGLGDWIDWRKAFRGLGKARPAPATLDLRLFARFAALRDDRNTRAAGGWRVWHRAMGDRPYDALVVRNESLPGFVGILMGRKQLGVDMASVPDWLGLEPVPA